MRNDSYQLQIVVSMFSCLNMRSVPLGTASSEVRGGLLVGPRVLLTSAEELRNEMIMNWYESLRMLLFRTIHNYQLYIYIYTYIYIYQYWVFSTDSSILSTQYSVLSIQYWILNTPYTVLSIQYSILSTECWVVCIQYWVLSTQYWIFSTQDSKYYYAQYSVFSIQSSMLGASVHQCSVICVL